MQNTTHIKYFKGMLSFSTRFLIYNKKNVSIIAVAVSKIKDIRFFICISSIIFILKLINLLKLIK